MASRLPEEPGNTLRPVVPDGGLLPRAKRLIMTPRLEWRAIDAEPMTVRGIMTGWVMPLAAIGPVAGLIGALVFGYGAFGIYYRPSPAAAVTSAVLSYALTLVGTWVLALIIDALAPTFASTKNPVAAMKVAAFSATAGWLAGVFGILPAIAFLSILGLYSLYLLYLGLPLLMRTPADKAVGYLVAVIVASVVVFLVVGAVTGAIATRVMTPVLIGGTSGTLAVPGVGAVDMTKLDAATKQMSAAADQIQEQNAHPKPATASATLQALLPTAVDGWSRMEVESSSGGAGGVGASTATGHYKLGDDTLTVSISDIGAMGAMAALGGAFNVQSNKETATGYEKASVVAGRMTTEKWDSADHSGSYTIIVGNRFVVTAEGTARDAASFKRAVEAVDPAKLEALAKA